MKAYSVLGYSKNQLYTILDEERDEKMKSGYYDSRYDYNLILDLTRDLPGYSVALYDRFNKNYQKSHNALIKISDKKMVFDRENGEKKEDISEPQNRRSRITVIGHGSIGSSFLFCAAKSETYYSLDAITRAFRWEKLGDTRVSFKSCNFGRGPTRKGTEDPTRSGAWQFMSLMSKKGIKVEATAAYYVTRISWIEKVNEEGVSNKVPLVYQSNDLKGSDFDIYHRSPKTRRLFTMDLKAEVPTISIYDAYTKELLYIHERDTRKTLYSKEEADKAEKNFPLLYSYITNQLKKKNNRVKEQERVLQELQTFLEAKINHPDVKDSNFFFSAYQEFYSKLNDVSVKETLDSPWGEKILMYIFGVLSLGSLFLIRQPWKSSFFQTISKKLENLDEKVQNNHEAENDHHDVVAFT